MPEAVTVQAGRNLALERVPGGIDIGGPDDGSLALHAGVRIAGEDQRALPGSSLRNPS